MGVFPSSCLLFLDCCCLLLSAVLTMGEKKVVLDCSGWASPLCRACVPWEWLFSQYSCLSSHGQQNSILYLETVLSRQVFYPYPGIIQSLIVICIGSWAQVGSCPSLKWICIKFYCFCRIKFSWVWRVEKFSILHSNPNPNFLKDIISTIMVLLLLLLSLVILYCCTYWRRIYLSGGDSFWNT